MFIRVIVRLLALYSVMIYLSACVVMVPYIESDHQSPASQWNSASSTNNYTANYGVQEKAGPGGVKECPLELRSFFPEPAVTKPRITKRRIRANTPSAKMARALRLLKHKNPAVRTRAASDLGLIGRAAAPAVPVLARSARFDKSKWVRRAAVKSLAKIGTPDVIDPIRSALKDRNKWVVHSAQNALNRLRYRKI